MDQSELHNSLVGPLIRGVMKPVLESGGTVFDALVVLESVVLGVIMMAEKLQACSSEGALLAVTEAVTKRLADNRLLNIEPQGHA